MEIQNFDLLESQGFQYLNINEAHGGYTYTNQREQHSYLDVNTKVILHGNFTL